MEVFFKTFRKCYITTDNKKKSNCKEKIIENVMKCTIIKTLDGKGLSCPSMFAIGKSFLT